MKAELIPDNGDPPIPIARDITVIGRREYCDVQIDDPSISKRHCVMVRTSGLLILRDLASTNGTKVKGQRIRWAALLPGDRVGFGGYKVRVYLGPDDVPSPSEQEGHRPEPMTGFAAPTPPVLAPFPSSGTPPVVASPSTVPAVSPVARPSGPEPDVIELNEDDLVAEDEDEDRGGGWEKLRPASGRDQFFIELD